jgi:hypothetical protein
MRRLLTLLLTAFLLVFGLAACGGDDGGGEDPQALLKETFGPGKPIRSGKLDLAIDLDLKGVPNLTGPVKLALRGPFQTNGARKLPNFDFDLAVNAGGRNFTAGAVSTGEAGFLTIENQAFDIGDELFESFRKGYEEAQQRSAKDDGQEAPSLQALGIDPMRWLRDPKSEGTEDVGGTKSTHISATLDVPRFVEDLNQLLEKGRGLQVEGAGAVPEPLTDEQRKQLEAAIKGAQVDVWTGEEDRTLRRLRLDVQLDVPESARSGVGGLTGGRIAFNLGFADLNEDQQIAAPEDPRPIGELTAALEALGGGGAGAQGGGTATTPQPGTTTDPQSGAAADYAGCVEQAGQDVAKLQECAELLR